MAQRTPTLPPAKHLSIDQLQQIQKRLQALVASTGQFQAELAVAPNFDWQTLLTRYGTLVSQVYSLSSSLTSPSSAYIPAQQDALNKYLEDEAKTRNFFMQEDDESGQSVQNAVANMPQVKYTDEKNALSKLVATPVHPLQGDKAGRLGEALRTKLDPDVEAAMRDTGDYERTNVDLDAVTSAIANHDDISKRALRTWYHVRWRPDEGGQTYDFKMRLPDDDDGVLDEENILSTEEQDEGPPTDAVQEEEILEDYEDDAGEEGDDDDEEMEDVV